MSAYPWPSREEWAASYNDVYHNDVDDVIDALSQLAESHAAPEQVTAAITELEKLWPALGAKVRAANAAAKAAFPLFGQPWTPAWGEAFEALPAEAQRAVEDAQWPPAVRRYVRDAIKSLQAGVIPDAHVAAAVGAEGGRAFATVMAGYREAVKAAVDAYVYRIESRVPDDLAWQRELDRRTRLAERWAEGQVVVHLPG